MSSEHEMDTDRRQRIVDRAVAAADRIIIDSSRDPDETNYLTLEVARKFGEKVHFSLLHVLRLKAYKKEFE